jgi:hypothetical protein
MITLREDNSFLHVYEVLSGDLADVDEALATFSAAARLQDPPALAVRGPSASSDGTWLLESRRCRGAVLLCKHRTNARVLNSA